MSRIFLFMVFLLPVLPVTSQNAFYNFTVNDIEGHPFPLSALKGKKVMVVNTASKCGFTPQYKQLQTLFETYGGEKFTIIGFPANNFLHQEPGTDSEIADFCEKNYGVTFPMMSKISVKGKDMHPLYQWLTSKSKNGVMDSQVSWNFQKYLIDENGRLVDVVKPAVKPDDERIIRWLTK
jgi:glutathione peroxidase